MKKSKISPPPFFKWLIWALAAAFYLYEFVLRVSPSVMIPELMKSFNITASSIGILSAFYLYTYAPMQLPVGALMDRYGIKKILSIASIVCGLGALFFAIGRHFYIACIGRSLIGIGSSFAFIAMVYVSSHWFTKNKRAFLIGIANSLAMLGASAGAGGPLASVIHTIGWQKTIAIFGIFGIFLGIVIYFIFKIAPKDYESEEKSSHNKMHLFENLKSVMKKKETWIIACGALFFYTTTTAFGGLWGLSFIQTAYGVSKETAGYAVSMIFAGWLIGGPLTGFFSDFLGKRNTAIRIGIIGTLLCLIPVIYLPSISIYVVYVLLFLVGFFSSAELLSFSFAIEINDARAKASAAAFTNFLISCGDALVQPLVGFLLDSNWSGALENGIRVYGIKSYQLALTALPIALIIAFFLLFFIKEKKLIKD
ncbi:MAG: MFS transporter [Parachlamydiales bacterium]|jgi:sugar phosphate permease